MSEPYEEILEGESHLRFGPGRRHEIICERLHGRVAACLEHSTVSRLLPPRSVIRISPGTMVRPDLVLVTAATGRPWLVAEIIDAGDHRIDTVVKKQIYEEVNLPRLWMIDPRYDNVEIYHGTPHGMALQKILASRELLRESLLPGFELVVEDLFSEGAPPASIF